MDQQTIIIIAVSAGSAGVLLLFVLGFILRNRLFKKVIKEEEKPTVIIDNNSWTASLGGKENIKGVELKGSRLIVQLNNNELINKDELHKLGVNSLIVSENKVTLVIKSDAEKVLNLLK